MTRRGAVRADQRRRWSTCRRQRPGTTPSNGTRRARDDERAARAARDAEAVCPARPTARAQVAVDRPAGREAGEAPGRALGRRSVEGLRVVRVEAGAHDAERHGLAALRGFAPSAAATVTVRGVRRAETRGAGKVVPKAPATSAVTVADVAPPSVTAAPAVKPVPLSITGWPAAKHVPFVIVSVDAAASDGGAASPARAAATAAASILLCMGTLLVRSGRSIIAPLLEIRSGSPAGRRPAPRERRRPPDPSADVEDQRGHEQRAHEERVEQDAEGDRRSRSR